MVRKLMKHELYALFRILIFFAAAVVIFAVIGRLLVAATLERGSVGGTMTLLFVLVIFFYVTAIALFVGVAWGLGISRFYKTLFTGEGYMTLSLPAKPTQILAAKMLSAFVAMAFASVVSILSLFIFFIGWNAQIMQTISEALSELARIIGEVMAQGEPSGRRAVIELRRSEASPMGWELCRFTVDDAALEEALTEGFFAQTMMEYLNAAYGYSIQYPAIFTEDMIVETASGIQAELPDGTASFSVARMPNDGHLTMNDVLAQEQLNNPGAKVSLDGITGAGKSFLTDEEGVTHVAVFLVSDGSIYQAELNYPQAREADFAQVSEYMMNSFSADELGLG